MQREMKTLRNARGQGRGTSLLPGAVISDSFRGSRAGPEQGFASSLRSLPRAHVCPDEGQGGSGGALDPGGFPP